MVLKLSRLIAAFAILVVVGLSSPALAHKEHNQAQPAAETADHHGDVAPRVATPGAMHEMMEEHGEQMEAQRPTTFAGRLMRWFGAMHPFAVHFPIALFPVSWLALIIARRRGHAVDLIRASIIVAGIAAVGAAILGWVSAGFAASDTDPILTAHRWTGTALALIGAIIALWTWRRAGAVNGRAMPWLLGAITIALLAQGWLGGVLVHGMEHMAF